MEAPFFSGKNGHSCLFLLTVLRIVLYIGNIGDSIFTVYNQLNAYFMNLISFTRLSKLTQKWAWRVPYMVISVFSPNLLPFFGMETQIFSGLVFSGKHSSRVKTVACESIVISDENIFCVEEKWNSQNSRVYSLTRRDIPEQFRTVQKLQHPTVMVWAGISALGKTPLVFISEGTKINTEVYTNIFRETGSFYGSTFMKNRKWMFSTGWCTSTHSENITRLVVKKCTGVFSS